MCHNQPQFIGSQSPTVVSWLLLISSNSGSCRCEFSSSFLLFAHVDVYQSAGKVLEKNECQQHGERNGERQNKWGDEGCVVLGDWMRIGGQRGVNSVLQVEYLSINQKSILFFFSPLSTTSLCRCPFTIQFDLIISVRTDSLTVCVRRCVCVRACARAGVCDQWYITVANLLKIKSSWQTNLSIRTHSKQSRAERACERRSER